MDLAPTTRMAIRAMAVATAAALVARLSFLERPYWIILTAVLLVYETAGESIKRSGQRLGMTFLGCLAGWGLYLAAAPVLELRWTILLGGIFLAVYFRSSPRGVAYAPMIFFASVYLVFVFSVVGGWTARLMLARLYDTALGCAVALVGSLVVLPQQAGLQLEDDLEQFWKACSTYFEKTYSALTAAGPSPTSEERQSLLKQLELMHMRNLISAYEGFLGWTARKRRQALVEGSERMCRHLLAFGAVVQAGPPASAVKVVLGSLGGIAQQTRAAFSRMSVAPLQALPFAPPSSTEKVDEDHSDLGWLLDAETLDGFEFLQLGPAIYHLDEACRSLELIVE